MLHIKLFTIFTIIFLSSLNAKYLDNHSCSECHEKIYEEYQSSSHSRSYFTNELHRKIADTVDKDKYSCATCHMPMADNLDDLISGKSRPSKNNKTHTDGVSCFFCHTIAYVKTAHNFNINIKARQAKNYKPTLYGRLVKPDDSDKHSSASNPVYGKKVCMGCHSHKLNENNATIFRAMEKQDSSISCINCHMPEVSGGSEKLNKKTRGKHASHKFLGIHDKAFRKRGLDINISTTQDTLVIKLKNKMTHPLIIQPARSKFLKITQIRESKIVWQNYKKSPLEDMQGYFSYTFKNGNKKVSIPAKATSNGGNNIEAKSEKILRYKLKDIKKGDTISVELLVNLAKDDCKKVIEINDSRVIDSSLMKRVEFIQN